MLLADAVDLLDQELPVCDGQRDHVDTLQIQMLFQILFGDNGTALPAGTAGDDHPAGSTAVEQALAQGRHVLERIGQCLPQRGQASGVRGKAGGFNGHQRDGYLNGVDHDAAFLLDHLKHLLEAAHVINGKNAALAVTLQNAVFQLAVNQLQVLVQVHVVGGDLASADGRRVSFVSAPSSHRNSATNADSSGRRVTLNSFSTFVISWEEKAYSFLWVLMICSS